VSGSDNPYALLTVFGKGHQATKNGGAVYITSCVQVEVVPRQATNCTMEIPATYNGTDVFVDPISLVIRSSGVPAVCNDIAPARYLISGKWFCAYPALRDCAAPGALPLDPIKINDIPLLGQGLGQSIYSKQQMESFSQFADSQDTRKAFLAETAHIAFGNRRDGKWGLGLTEMATEAIIDSVGNSLIPLYRILGPMASIIIMILFIAGTVKIVLDMLLRVILILKARGPGWWILAAVWQLPFQVAISPVRWLAHTADGITKRAADNVDKRAEIEMESRDRRVGPGGLDRKADTAAPIIQRPDNYPPVMQSPSWRRRLETLSERGTVTYPWQTLPNAPSGPSGPGDNP
jgi:hypothetical protein